MNRTIFLQRFALLVLSAMLTLPFLAAIHTTPIPSFHAEWLAGALGLAACFSLINARRLPLPGATLLALTLAGLALAQIPLGRAPLPQLTTLFVLYLLWAALLAATGSHLAETLGLVRLTRILAAATLCGALGAALLGLFQPWLQPLGWWGFSLQMGGPLGQINHLSVYLWLGLASALYLYATAVLSRRIFWIIAILLTLFVVLVGQRSSFLYVFALIIVASWQSRRQDDGQCGGETRRIALGIGLLFILMQPLAMLVPIPGGVEGRPPPALRAMQQLDGPSPRLQLWRVGLAGILASPLLGNGVGSYTGLAVEHADHISLGDNPGPAEHAHNLFIDLGAELGVSAALLVALAAIAWVRRLPQRAAPPEAVWAASVLLMLGLHSMIEYPLWHTFFLGLPALVAGAFGSRRRVGGRLAASALTLGLVAWGSLTLFELRRDYENFELAIALGGKTAALPLAKAALLRVPHDSLLAPWINTAACVSLDPLQVSVADGLAVCQVGMTFAPCTVCIANMAVLRWRNADTIGAHDLLRRLKRATQHNPEEIDALLAAVVARDTRLQALTQAKP